MRKLDDYAEKREKAAIANPEQIDFEENKKALKARRFRLELYREAETEEDPYKKDQEDRYPYPHI